MSYTLTRDYLCIS